MKKINELNLPIQNKIPPTDEAVKEWAKTVDLLIQRYQQLKQQDKLSK